MIPTYRRALIVGAGAGLSASLARLFHAKGLSVVLAARGGADLASLAATIGAETQTCDAADPASVAALFTALDASAGGAPDVVVYNPSARTRGSIVDLDVEETRRALEVTAFGAFLTAREAARRMVPNGHGALLFTGASASVKGYPLSAPFAMGKFAQRGLAQSLARELHPKGVHVAHVNVDGAIRSAPRGRVEIEGDGAPDRFLDPDAIAQTYWHLLSQDRSAWAWEIDLRPWVEAF